MRHKVLFTNNTMECIICKGSGAEPLYDNTICTCKYKRHNSCWVEYVHSTTKVKCLLCRKELKNPPRPTPSTPSAPLLEHEPLEVIIIPEETQTAIHEEYMHQLQSMNRLGKVIKVIFVLVILALVLFLFFRLLLL